MPKSNQLSAPQPLRVFLLGAGQRPEVLAEAERLRPMIEQHAEIVRTDFTGSEDLSTVEADLAIVLGGDGSILRAARQMGQRQGQSQPNIGAAVRRITGVLCGKRGQAPRR